MINQSISLGSCAAGEFRGVFGCEKCFAGLHSSANSKYCTRCKPGSYSEAGASECSQCSAGTFSGAVASECKACPKGTISRPGASHCVSLTGFFTNTTKFTQKKFNFFLCENFNDTICH